MFRLQRAKTTGIPLQRMSLNHMQLTPDEISRYRADGILAVERPLFTAEALAGLRTAFERRLEDWTGTFGQRPEQMDKPHFLYPEFFAWALDDGVLDLVEQLIGPDIALFTTHFICKPPRDGQRVPWHEDSAYWAGMIEPMDDVLTLWVAVDPSTPANGCMRAVPGSHLKPDSDYAPVTGQVFHREIVPGTFDPASVRDVVLPAGGFSIHHARTIHGSEPNLSPMRRCGFTMRYFSTRCRWMHSHDADPDFAIYLARGRDHAGNRYAEPGLANEAWRARLLAEVR